MATIALALFAIYAVVVILFFAGYRQGIEDGRIEGIKTFVEGKQWNNLPKQKTISVTSAAR